MHVPAMNESAHKLQHLLLVVGHSSRFRIVLELLQRPWHVGELAAEIGLSQSCTTRHLQALARARVVRTHRTGKRVLAQLDLDEPDVFELIRLLRDGGAAVDDAALPSDGDGRGAAAASPERGHRGRERTHAGGGTSGTPAAAPVEMPEGTRARPQPLEDFLL